MVLMKCGFEAGLHLSFLHIILSSLYFDLYYLFYYILLYFYYIFYKIIGKPDFAF